MRPNINRYKRTDYSQPVRARTASVKREALDSFSSISDKPKTQIKPVSELPAIVAAQEEPAQPEVTNNDTSSAASASPALSLRFSLPSFRQPPGVEGAPNKEALKKLLIAFVAVTFFIIGYHNLWHLLNT